MKRHFLPITIASLALAAPAGAYAAAAPVQITGFTISPTCVKPGGTVQSTTTVRNSGLLPETIYGQGSESVFGLTVERGPVVGPDVVPPLLSGSQTQSTPVPWYTPWGIYTVTAGIGPSSTSPTSYSTRSTSLIVSPFC